MATALKDQIIETSSNCPVCMESRTNLRKLPVCKHMFCEKCIFTHASKENGENSWHCPVCREPYAQTNGHAEIMEWIQNLEKVDGLVGQVEIDSGNDSAETSDSSMTKSSDSFSGKWDCQPCSKLSKTTTAIFYCPECQERFCGSCDNLFHSANALSHHGLIEIESTRRARSQDGEIGKSMEALDEIIMDCFKCKKHDNKPLMFMCKDDNELCCLSCVLNGHRKCNSVDTVRDFAYIEMTDEAINEVKATIGKLSAHCQTIIDVKNANEIENKKDSVKIIAHIHDMRTKINNLLDTLEDTVKQNCKALTKRNSIKALDDIDKLQYLAKDLCQSQSMIDKAKRECNMELMYVLIHNTKKQIQNYEDIVLQMSHDIKEPRFRLTVDPNWEAFVGLGPNDSARIASVTEYQTLPSLPKYQGRQLLCYCSLVQAGIHGVEKDKKLTKYSSILALPNNRLLLCDAFYSHCIILNDSFEREALIKFPENDDGKVRIVPHCAAVLSSGEIVISASSQKKLYLTSWNGKPQTVLQLRGFDMDRVPRALYGLSNGNLAVSWCNPAAFGIVSQALLREEVFFDRDMTGRIFKTFDFMAIDEKRSFVIQPCTKDRAIYCFDFKGHPQFSYRSRQLQKPCGVALDADGNVYACDSGTNTIHVLSVHGKFLRALTNKECPERPLAITFLKGGDRFIVTQLENNLWEYKLKASSEAKVTK